MKKDVRDSIEKRICFVCGKEVPEAGGLYCAVYRILVHNDKCSDVVSQHQRVYDRSNRGRWRPAREVLERLRAIRKQAGTPDAAGSV